MHGGAGEGEACEPGVQPDFTGVQPEDPDESDVEWWEDLGGLMCYLMGPGILAFSHIMKQLSLTPKKYKEMTVHCLPLYFLPSLSDVYRKLTVPVRTAGQWPGHNTVKLMPAEAMENHCERYQHCFIVYLLRFLIMLLLFFRHLTYRKPCVPACVPPRRLSRQTIPFEEEVDRS